MYQAIEEEYEKVAKKRDEVRKFLQKLENENPKDHYNIRITRDRLAYWEGKTEGLKFAIDHLSSLS